MLDEKQTKKLLEEVFPWEEHYDITPELDDDDETQIWFVSYRPIRELSAIGMGIDMFQDGDEGAFKQLLYNLKEKMCNDYNASLAQIANKIVAHLDGKTPKRVKYDEPGDLPF